MLRIDHTNCVGCTACEAICPVGAIELKVDDRGFLYPVLDTMRCIDCGLCNNVCLCYEEEIKSSNRLQERELYIAKHSDKQTQLLSQSGGVSFALGTEILSRGGIVYGCIYDKDCKAIHTRCSTVDQLKDTRGSKYVQSDLKATFNEVLTDLNQSGEVLFMGTSCQIAGLYIFLKRKNCLTENLYTVDFICHGVPSPKLLDDYKLYIEKKNNQKVIEINLRNMKFYPKQISTCYCEDGQEVHDNIFLELFYSNIALRECCGFCRYTTFDKPSDITMGDITGLNPKYNGSIDEGHPPSIVIIHSKQGLELLEKSELSLISVETGDFNQLNLRQPSNISHQKEKFWKDYKNYGFKYILNKYTSVGGIKVKIKRRIYKKLGLW